jgi:hypothetical protein
MITIEIRRGLVLATEELPAWDHDDDVRRVLENGWPCLFEMEPYVEPIEANDVYAEDEGA